MNNHTVNKYNNQLSVEMQLLKFEELLLDPGIRENLHIPDQLLSEDFIEFGSSGRVYDKRTVLESLRNEAYFEAVIHDFQVRCLSENTMLATYTLYVADRTGHLVVNSLRSSVWKLIDNYWQIVFHQGTKTGD